MQFWRDTLEAVFSGRAVAEPVALLLRKVLAEDGAPLSRAFFQRVIASRVGAGWGGGGGGGGGG